MPILKIDLKTRTLMDAPSVYMVRPGQKYHLFETFVSNAVMAADAPFLNLADSLELPSPNSIESMLERALAFREWGNASNRRRGPRPGGDLERHQNFLSDQGGKAKRTRLRNAAQQILWTIEDKSLIFVPAPSLSGYAILAEAGPRVAPRLMVHGTGKRESISYPSRGIERIKMVAMRDLPPVVTEPSGTVSVVNEFEGYASERLLREYYGDYQQGNRASVTEFMNGADDLDSRVVAQMIALSMSIQLHMDTGTYKSPQSMVFGQADRVAGPKFHARVNSKDGKVHFEAASIVPHVLKVFMIIAATNLPSDILAQEMHTQNVAISNSEIQEGPNVVVATQNALVNYAASAGIADVKEILDSLRVEIALNDGKVDGVAGF
jgi:hypothetical protein